MRLNPHEILTKQEHVFTPATLRKKGNRQNTQVELKLLEIRNRHLRRKETHRGILLKHFPIREYNEVYTFIY